MYLLIYLCVRYLSHYIVNFVVKLIPFLSIHLFSHLSIYLVFITQQAKILISKIYGSMSILMSFLSPIVACFIAINLGPWLTYVVTLFCASGRCVPLRISVACLCYKRSFEGKWRKRVLKRICKVVHCNENTWYE